MIDVGIHCKDEEFRAEMMRVVDEFDTVDLIRGGEKATLYVEPLADFYAAVDQVRAGRGWLARKTA